MVNTETAHSRVGAFIILVLGSGLFFLHIHHAFSGRESLESFVLGIWLPMAFTLIVLLGGIWLWHRYETPAHVLRVSLWCVVGAVVLTIGAGFTILYEQVKGVQMAQQFYVFVNAASAGAVIGLLVGNYDVQQRTERDRAERLSHQLSVLNRVLRHDIRTGANVIQGRVELLTDQHNGHAETIHQQATKLVKLGEHARALERLLREPEIDRETIDLVPIIETQLEELNREAPHADITASLPVTAHITAHPLVESAISNVITNAVEHNEKSTPEIQVRCSRVSENGSDVIRLRVSDNGPGIPDAEIAVLERGYETPLDHTSGLGLWLVNWIVNESGGRVWFEQNSPTGSTVNLEFEHADAGSIESPIQL